MTQVRNILTGLMLLAVAPAVAAAAEGGEHAWSLKTDLPLWGLVAFIGFVWAVRKLGWQSFVDGMTERERTEVEAIAEAEEKNRLSQQELIERKGLLEAVGETERELIEEAQRDAERTRQDIAESARNEADTLRKRALREIERTRDQSLKGLFDVMSQRVVERTGQQLADSLTAEDQARLMDESLAEFAASAK